MTFDLGMPLLTELALAALAIVILLIGIVWQREAGRIAGIVAFVGVLGVLGLTFLAEEGRSLLGGSFVQDALAVFAKRLFLAAAALSLLGSLTQRQGTFGRRAAEYHFALVASLLGMSVLASARELILLFVAF